MTDNIINPFIEDDGYISKEHWDSYVSCADGLEYVGYIEATTAITDKLDSLMQQQREYNIPLEKFREEVEKIVVSRKELISYDNMRRGLEP